MLITCSLLTSLRATPFVIRHSIYSSFLLKRSKKSNFLDAMRLIAKTLEGLEPILAAELKQIGAENIIPKTREVVFDGDKRVLYRANLEVRTALRILYPIASFRARTQEHLYESISDIDWSRYMNVEHTMAIDAVLDSEYFTHTAHAALKSKDAIAEQFRYKFGDRPSIDTIRPTVRIHLEIKGDECEVSLDSSSDSLAKRGFDYQALETPINEILAAAMILMSDWKGERDFIDPMCGSGTFLTEAAMIAYNIPPMLHREFWSFHKWKNFDKELWEDVLTKAKAKIKPSIQGKIIGFDSAFQPVRVSDRNIEAAGLKGKVEVSRLAFEKQKAISHSAILMMQPPYDAAVSEDKIRLEYKSFGEILKKKFANSEAWLVSSNLEISKFLGIDAAQEIDVNDSVLPCKIAKYKLDSE
jgi:putative N6-adenine-specific DNA methylase